MWGPLFLCGLDPIRILVLVHGHLIWRFPKVTSQLYLSFFKSEVWNYIVRLWPLCSSPQQINWWQHGNSNTSLSVQLWLMYLKCYQTNDPSPEISDVRLLYFFVLQCSLVLVRIVDDHLKTDHLKTVSYSKAKGECVLI